MTESEAEGRDWEVKSCRECMEVCILQWGSTNGLAEASHCLENDTDVILMLLLYLEVERRDWKRQLPALAALWKTWDLDLSLTSNHLGLSGEHHSISRNCATKVQLFPFIPLQSLAWQIHAEPVHTYTMLGSQPAYNLKRLSKRGWELLASPFYKWVQNYGEIKCSSQCSSRSTSHSRDQSESVMQKQYSAPGLSLGPALLELLAQTEMPILVQGPAPHGTLWHSRK